MTNKQFKIVLALFGLLIAGQWIQTALQLRSSARIQQSAESAEASGIDTIELSKSILHVQQPGVLLPALETPLEIAARKGDR